MVISVHSDGMKIDIPVVMGALGLNVSIVGVDGKTKKVAFTTPSGPQPGCPASVVDATSTSNIQPQPQPKRIASQHEARRQNHDAQPKPKQHTTTSNAGKGGSSRPQQQTHYQHGDYHDPSQPQPQLLPIPPVNPPVPPTPQVRRTRGGTGHAPLQASPGSRPQNPPSASRMPWETGTPTAGGPAYAPTGFRSKPHPHLVRKPLPLWQLHREGGGSKACAKSPSSPSSIQSEIYKRKRSRGTGKKADRELIYYGRV